MVQKLVVVKRNQNQEEKFLTFLTKLATVKKEILHIIAFLHFNNVFNLVFSSNEESFLKCRHDQQKKLRNLIPSYNPGTSPNSHDSGKVTSISHTVSDSEKSLPCKGLRFASPPKED